MKKEEFEKLLDNHDWWYSNSDDPSKFAKGLRELNEIQEICEKDSKLKEIYEKRRRKIYNLS